MQRRRSATGCRSASPWRATSFPHIADGDSYVRIATRAAPFCCSPAGPQLTRSTTSWASSAQVHAGYSRLALAPLGRVMLELRMLNLRGRALRQRGHHQTQTDRPTDRPTDQQTDTQTGHSCTARVRRASGSARASMCAPARASMCAACTNHTSAGACDCAHTQTPAPPLQAPLPVSACLVCCLCRLSGLLLAACQYHGTNIQSRWPCPAPPVKVSCGSGRPDLCSDRGQVSGVAIKASACGMHMQQLRRHKYTDGTHWRQHCARAPPNAAPTADSGTSPARARARCGVGGWSFSPAPPAAIVRGERIEDASLV